MCVDKVEKNVDTILFSPKIKTKIVDDDKKEAFDKEMEKINSTKLELNSKIEMRCHLSNNSKTKVLSDQWDSTFKTPDSSMDIKVHDNIINDLYGSGPKTPLIAKKFGDPEEKLTQNLKTRLGGVPLEETIEAGPSSAYSGFITH